jgi:hypothetical protein
MSCREEAITELVFTSLHFHFTLPNVSRARPSLSHDEPNPCHTYIFSKKIPTN